MAICVGRHHAAGGFHQVLAVRELRAGHLGQQVFEPGQAQCGAELVHLAAQRIGGAQPLGFIAPGAALALAVGREQQGEDGGAQFARSVEA